MLRPLREFGSPLADNIQPIAYTVLQGAPDAGFPPGRLHYWKSSYLKELSDEAIGVIVGFISEMPSTTTGVNDLGDEGEDRVKAAYGGNYERLLTFKGKYDLNNLFRLNQNIRQPSPAIGGAVS